MYTPPLSINPGHGLYALIGHHANSGIAPIPPWIRPLPSHCIFSFASPHESHDPEHAPLDASPSGDAFARATCARRVARVVARVFARVVTHVVVVAHVVVVVVARIIAPRVRVARCRDADADNTRSSVCGTSTSRRCDDATSRVARSAMTSTATTTRTTTRRRPARRVVAARVVAACVALARVARGTAGEGAFARAQFQSCPG